MKDFIVNKKFCAGFLIGIVLGFVINLLPNKIDEYGGCCVSYGFPFFYNKVGYTESEELIRVSEIFWSGLAGDLLFALLIAALTGSGLRLLMGEGTDRK